jgi:hypothetical protein
MSSLPSDRFKAGDAQTMATFGLNGIAQGRQTDGTFVAIVEFGIEVSFVAAHGR